MERSINILKNKLDKLKDDYILILERAGSDGVYEDKLLFNSNKELLLELIDELSQQSLDGDVLGKIEDV